MGIYSIPFSLLRSNLEVSRSISYSLDLKIVLLYICIYEMNRLHISTYFQTLSIDIKSCAVCLLGLALSIQHYVIKIWSLRCITLLLISI